MAYFDTLTTAQKNNIAAIIKRLSEKQITNKFAQAGILSVCSKESAFTPKSETDYSKTSIARIRQIFPKHAIISKMSDQELDVLKKNPKSWFNTLYNGKNGNKLNSDDGYNYRGRGLNQITFYNAYKKIGDQIGVDLVKNPDKLNELPVAIDALIQYYLNFFAVIPKELLKHYKTTGLNGFADLKNAVTSCYHANAGWGRTIEYIRKDHTGGLKKAMDRSEGFLKMIN